MIIVETDVENRKLKFKDYRQIPYVGEMSDPLELKKFIKYYIEKYEAKSLDLSSLNGVIEDL